MTQGDPISPTIFNIMVDAVVRAVLLELIGPQEAHHRLSWEAKEHNIVLYAYNGHIVACKPIWSQKPLTTVVRMFESVGM